MPSSAYSWPPAMSSDPRLASMAAELLPELARRSGMELSKPVRLETRSREELARYLTSKLDEDLPESEARARVDGYARYVRTTSSFFPLPPRKDPEAT